MCVNTPKSANVYDSLSEVYMKACQKDLAVQNYETALTALRASAES